MTKLSSKNLPTRVRSFAYDRDLIKTGIVHFGIGNFHRAHQAVYVEDLLEKGETKWGIAGVSLRSGSMKAALEPQDYVYTLAILGERSEYRVIGALKDMLVAPDQRQAVIDLIAKPTTHLVSSTITEKGYCLASGKVDTTHPSLIDELGSLEKPITIYGYLARGLMKRYQTAPPAKLTIMCCDNISAGGDLLAEGVGYLLQNHSPDTFKWVHDNVTFISSMVDRVSPATDDKLRDAVLRDTGRIDASPVSTENFTQWIIEDNFAGERPPFDRVGANFVEDIVPFEDMKLRYLNAAHTITSCLGYLFGDEYVHEALKRPDVLPFLRKALYGNVLPNADVPDGYNGETYIEDVIARFRNSSLPYANLQVGTDSSQKIQQRWFPTIDTALRQGADCSFFEFSLAAWVVFIQTALKNDVLSDPKKSEFLNVGTAEPDGLARPYLKICNAEKYAFISNAEFMSAVESHVIDINTSGIAQSLKGFLESN